MSQTLEDILGKQVRYGPETVEISTLLQSGAEFVGIYFGAHWAPPCRLFTGALEDFYNAINFQGQKKNDGK